MADSPIPIARQGENEMIEESSDRPISTPRGDVSISEEDNLPIFVKSDERTSSHVDENNENEAVRKISSLAHRKSSSEGVFLGFSTCDFVCC